MRQPIVFIGGGGTHDEKRADWERSSIGSVYKSGWTKGMKLAPWIGAAIGWTVLGPIAAWAGYRAGRAARRNASAAEVAKEFLRGYAQAELVGAMILGADIGVKAADRALKVADNPDATEAHAEQATKQLKPNSTPEQAGAAAAYVRSQGLDPENEAHAEQITALFDAVAANYRAAQAGAYTPTAPPQSQYLASSNPQGYSFGKGAPASPGNAGAYSFGRGT